MSITKRSTAVMVMVLFGALLLMPSVAKADSISPSVYTNTIGVGESVTVRKTVTVTTEAPTSALVDVFFLSDTTGSMGGLINSVKTNASTIMTNTSALGNVQYGVGEYKDVGDTFVYRLNQNITANTGLVQTGINAWGASGGGDGPEANLYALKQVADTSAWRTFSNRIVLWFGDAVGHDPRNGVTEAQATAALVAQGIKVEALNVGNLDGTGQATRIAAATGGTYFPAVDTSAIVDAIEAALAASFENYTKVGLGFAPLAGLGIDVVPAAGYTGIYDRSIERTFGFDVTFTGLAPGDYSFDINALVDGGSVAAESDRITVTGGTSVPEPTSLLLLGAGLFGAFFARRLRRKTI